VSSAVIPASLVLPARGYLVLWPDGNSGASDTHLPFRLAMEGEHVAIWSPDGELLDDVEFPPLPADTAMARVPDASEDWELVPCGTPGEANEGF